MCFRKMNDHRPSLTAAGSAAAALAAAGAAVPTEKCNGSSSSSSSSNHQSKSNQSKPNYQSFKQKHRKRNSPHFEFNINNEFLTKIKLYWTQFETTNPTFSKFIWVCLQILLVLGIYYISFEVGKLVLVFTLFVLCFFIFVVPVLLLFSLTLQFIYKIILRCTS